MDIVNRSNFDAIGHAMGSGICSGDFLPAVYVVEITTRCNVKCVMCPNSKFDSIERGDIDEQLFMSVIDRIAPYAELVMLYFMGESTLHHSFLSLLTYARNKISGKIVVSTNALALSDNTINELVRNADVIIACIDRWNKEYYEKIRLGSRFEDVVLSVERILSVRNNSVHPVVIVKALDIALKGDTAESRALEMNQLFEYWSVRGAVPLAGWLNTWAGQLGKLKAVSCQGTPYVGVKRSACADLWFKMVINRSGQVVLCCHDWRSSTVIGSLHQESIKEVWHSEKMVHFRHAHLSENFNISHLCDGCREWGEESELKSYIRLDNDDLYRVF